MRRRNLIRKSVPAIAVVFALCAGCGSDSTGPDGNGSDGPAEEFGAVLSESLDKFFANNALAFLSLQTYAPAIQTALSGAANGSQADVAFLGGGSCVDAGVLGTTYAYNFQQGSYSPTTMTGAPQDAVRFLLYQAQQQAGHVDLRCPSTLPGIDISLTMVWNNVTVLDMAGVGQLNQNLTWNFNSTIADITDPQSGDIMGLSTGGTGLATQVNTSRVSGDVPGEGVTFSFSRNDVEGVAIIGNVIASSWTVFLDYSGASASDMTGFATLSTPASDPAVIACLSGSYDAVNANAAGEACANTFPVATGISAAERSAIEDGYDALHDMLEVMITLIRAGIEIATG